MDSSDDYKTQKQSRDLVVKPNALALATISCQAIGASFDDFNFRYSFHF